MPGGGENGLLLSEFRPIDAIVARRGNVRVEGCPVGDGVDAMEAVAVVMQCDIAFIAVGRDAQRKEHLAYCGQRFAYGANLTLDSGTHQVLLALEVNERIAQLHLKPHRMFKLTVAGCLPRGACVCALSS